MSEHDRARRSAEQLQVVAFLAAQGHRYRRAQRRADSPEPQIQILGRGCEIVGMRDDQAAVSIGFCQFDLMVCLMMAAFSPRNGRNSKFVPIA